MKMKMAKLALLAPLLLSGANAWSSASTSATITDLRIELVDLDPTDEIMPTIQFDPYGVSTAQADIYATTPPLGRDLSNSGSAPFAAVSASLSDAGTVSRAAISGGVFGSGATASVAAQTSATAGYSIAEGTVGFANQVEIHRFTLSPETEIVISGNTMFQASVAHDQAAEQADSGLYLAIGDANGNWASASSWVDEGVYADQSTMSPQTWSDSFRISFSNTSSVAFEGSVGGYLGAYATSEGPVQATPVPEPAPAAMLLIGFVVFTYCSRRAAARA